MERLAEVSTYVNPSKTTKKRHDPDLKVQPLENQRVALEAKWGRSFDEFQCRIEVNSLEGDVYSFAVEQDYWQWEKNETLRQYDEDLRAKWM